MTQNEDKPVEATKPIDLYRIYLAAYIGCATPMANAPIGHLVAAAVAMRDRQQTVVLDLPRTYGMFLDEHVKLMNALPVATATSAES